ncbi:MAG: PAS domain-containing protein, partial [Phycisphaerae bacterium]|nr:PAS domain-containing protein [Gemmatimonadaceae bacterium]
DLATRLARTTDFEAGSLSALTLLRKYLRASHVELELMRASDRRILTAEAPASLVGALPVSGAPTGTVRHSLPLMAAGEPVGLLVLLLPSKPTGELQAVLQVAADMLAATVARALHTSVLETEVVARVREVTEQRRFIERVVDSFPAGLYVVDREYRIHLWNRKRETGMQGVSRDEAIGRTIFEVLHRQPASLLKREFDEVFASGRLQQFQMESSATGDVRTFRISKIPMRLDDDVVTHVITLGEDITEWKAALDRTAQNEKLAAIGHLAAGVMHEINNPLATIAACAESLALIPTVTRTEAAGAGSPPSELLRIIDLEVHRCKRIVNGLLDFARPKPATRQPLDLNTVVQHALFLLQHHPQYKRVKVVTELEVDQPIMVHGDADQLVQVLMALAINAFDATPDGNRVTIRTRSTHATELALYGVFEVADDGPGIPRVYHTKIFEPFFTTKSKGHGTGLGLAISYGIISDHGGVLELVSTEPPGATFRVSLPLVKA